MESPDSKNLARIGTLNRAWRFNFTQCGDPSSSSSYSSSLIRGRVGETIRRCQNENKICSDLGINRSSRKLAKATKSSSPLQPSWSSRPSVRGCNSGSWKASNTKKWWRIGAMNRATPVGSRGHETHYRGFIPLRKQVSLVTLDGYDGSWKQTRHAFSLTQFQSPSFPRIALLRGDFVGQLSDCRGIEQSTNRQFDLPPRRNASPNSCDQE